MCVCAFEYTKSNLSAVTENQLMYKCNEGVYRRHIFVWFYPQTVCESAYNFCSCLAEITWIISVSILLFTMYVPAYTNHSMKYLYVTWMLNFMRAHAVFQSYTHTLTHVRILLWMCHLRYFIDLIVMLPCGLHCPKTMNWLIFMPEKVHSSCVWRMNRPKSFRGIMCENSKYRSMMLMMMSHC